MLAALQLWIVLRKSGFGNSRMLFSPYEVVSLQFECECGSVRLDNLESSMQAMCQVVSGLVREVQELRRDVKRLKRLEDVASQILVCDT